MQCSVEEAVSFNISGHICRISRSSRPCTTGPRSSSCSPHPRGTCCSRSPGGGRSSLWSHRAGLSYRQRERRRESSGRRSRRLPECRAPCSLHLGSSYWVPPCPSSRSPRPSRPTRWSQCRPDSPSSSSPPATVGQPRPAVWWTGSPRCCGRRPDPPALPGTEPWPPPRSSPPWRTCSRNLRTGSSRGNSWDWGRQVAAHTDTDPAVTLNIKY